MNFKPYLSKLIIILIISLLLIIGGVICLFFKQRPSFPIFADDKFVKICEENDSKCHQTNLPYQNSALSTEARVADLLNRMTNAE